MFVGVELGLLIKFVLLPLAKLFKLKEGIDEVTASKLIGRHFPEVNDKLVNVLQLKQTKDQSELLLASIEQKSTELSPIPFKLAINFKKNTKYLKYAAIPILIILLSFVTGKIDWFNDSYTRVVNYKTAYEPPAPFQFFVMNDLLQVVEGNDYKVVVKTAGKVQPDQAQITFNDADYFFNKTAEGTFEYTISKPTNDVSFTLYSGNVRSKTYTLQVIKAPVVTDFEMQLDYPSYTGKRDETIKSSGNAVVPSGTKITWKLQTQATDKVLLVAQDTTLFHQESNTFTTTKHLFKDLPYSLTTSNEQLKDYESLSFSIDVISDEYPEISVRSAIDSLDQQTMYFYGQVSDDYGLRKLQLVYYPVDDMADKQVVPITISKSNIAEFAHIFPNQLPLKDGVSYELFFQVFDNDAFIANKNTKSNVFTYRKLAADELQNQQLDQQGETIKQLDKSLEKLDANDKNLERIAKSQKEKATLNFNDKRQLQNFLKRQKQQEELMKSFNKKLQNNLEQFEEEAPKNDFKEDLKDRLKANEEELEQNEKLLEELQKMQEKINKENLTEKLEQLAKQNKNQKRSLEQLLELTKKYYVTKKMEKLQQELEQMAEEQLQLSEEQKDEQSQTKQDSLNRKFQDFQKEMDALKKENESLIDPMKLPNNERSQEQINQDQKEASEALKEQQKEQDAGAQEQAKEQAKKASQKQKQAGQKMKQMSQQMQQSMGSMAGGSEQMQEDLEMLRQILDNLVLFSFDQERLMKQFKTIDVNHNKYANYLKRQHTLKEHFSHIDDSLFALSLRQPKIATQVNKEISDAFFNMDKALDVMSENRIYQGVSYQQYTITAANNLADFLSNIMNAMQMQMSGQGQSGQGMDMQLPDIIMSQEELNKQMQEGLKKQGEQGKQQQGEGQEGQQGQEGNESQGNEKGNKPGEQGQSNSEGNEGQQQEDAYGDIFKIYQQQQELRRALEDKLKQQGLDGQADQLLKQMEDVEQDLLNKGFSNQTLQKMLQLKHRLLQMENATFQQEQDTKRESETNQKQFNNSTHNTLPSVKEFFNTNEILNRQALPLQPIYNKKVKAYFNTTE
ncbi:ATPase [Mangrovimonas yunxiaonensis]|nr:ATPase [Mangrovimonas yunxiaonensis]